MSAIQPAVLPTAATMLIGIEPGGEPGGEISFEAQLSALLGAFGPDGPATTPTGAPLPVAPGLAMRALRGGKDGAANGNAAGKTDGNILPDALAGPNAYSGDSIDTDPADPDVDAGRQTIQPAAPEATPLLLTLVIGPALLPGAPQQSDTAKALAGSAQNAAPSTAPAMATAMAGTVAMRRALPGDRATLPPAALPAAVAVPAPGATAKPRDTDAPSAARTASAVPPIPIDASRLAGQTPVSNDAPAAAAATPSGVPVRATATTGAAPSPPGMPATLQMLGESATAAAPVAAAQQAQKSTEPAIPSEPALTASSAGPESLAAAPAPTSAASQGSAPQAPAAPTAPQAHDFAALVDKLVEARQAVQSTLSNQTVQASVQHAEFGRVSLNFQQDAAGMTVTFANPDPDLVRAVQSLAVPAASTGTGSAGTNDNGNSNARQDWQGGNAAGSGQSNGQSSSLQQRGQAPQREHFSDTARRSTAADEAPSNPSAPRNGIFA